MDKNVTACDLPEIVVYKGIETTKSLEEDRNSKVDDDAELCNDPKTNQDVEEASREDFADAEGSSSSCNQDHLIVTREAKDSLTSEIEVATLENGLKESKTLGDILSWEDEPKPLEEQSQPQLQEKGRDEPKEAEEKLSSVPTTTSQEPNKPFNDNQQPSLVVGDTLEDNKLISSGFGETSFSAAEAVSISGVSEKIVIGMAPPRKLMIISSEHENVMKSGAQESSSEQPRVTSSSGKSKNEEKRLGEEEEEKALSKYLSMDYPRIKQNPKSLVWGLSLPALRFTHCNMMAGLVEDYSEWVRRLVFKEDECQWYPTRTINVSNKLFSNQNILGSEYCMNVTPIQVNTYSPFLYSTKDSPTSQLTSSSLRRQSFLQRSSFLRLVLLHHQEERKRCWIWPSSLTRVFKLSSPVVDKSLELSRATISCSTLFLMGL
ncbi:unnamed protein product [Brassica rapa subsp. narinosa]